MFENLTQRIGGALDRVRGRGRLSEAQVDEALREVRVALLEADVALDAVRAFVERVREQAVGQDVLKSLTPGQEVVRIVRDELTVLMGEKAEGLALAAAAPAVVLMAGLQGAGKTTTAAKLAQFLGQRDRKSVLLASADVYRPAAIDQLRTLAGQVGCNFFESTPEQAPVAIARAAVDEARRRVIDVLILDTAGRLHIDSELMDEIAQVHAAVNPVETLFVVDSMAGQDAVNAARAFNDTLALTGVVLTKADGDARGGAALSVRHVTGKPIKFLGLGEKLDALEAFHPDRMAQRILGMGDVLGLIEEAERKVDTEKAAALAKKVAKGQGFDLDDFAEQIRQMRNMGGMAGLLDKLPGVASIPPAVKGKMADDGEFSRIEAMIYSMTPGERRKPDIIKASRKQRIAAGSGTRVQDVNKLLKQFAQMQKMMKRARKSGGMQRMLASMTNQLPPGMQR